MAIGSKNIHHMATLLRGKVKKVQYKSFKEFLNYYNTFHSNWKTFKKLLWNIKSSRTLEFIQLSLSPSLKLQYTFSTLIHFLFKYFNQLQTSSFTGESGPCIDTF